MASDCDCDRNTRRPTRTGDPEDRKRGDQVGFAALCNADDSQEHRINNQGLNVGGNNIKGHYQSTPLFTISSTDKETAEEAMPSTAATTRRQIAQ